MKTIKKIKVDGKGVPVNDIGMFLREQMTNFLNLKRTERVYNHFIDLQHEKTKWKDELELIQKGVINI